MEVLRDVDLMSSYYVSFILYKISLHVLYLHSLCNRRNILFRESSCLQTERHLPRICLRPSLLVLFPFPRNVYCKLDVPRRASSNIAMYFQGEPAIFNLVWPGSTKLGRKMFGTTKVCFSASACAPVIRPSQRLLSGRRLVW